MSREIVRAVMQKLGYEFQTGLVRNAVTSLINRRNNDLRSVELVGLKQLKALETCITLLSDELNEKADSNDLVVRRALKALSTIIEGRQARLTKKFVYVSMMLDEVSQHMTIVTITTDPNLALRGLQHAFYNAALPKIRHSKIRDFRRATMTEMRELFGSKKSVSIIKVPDTGISLSEQLTRHTLHTIDGCEEWCDKPGKIAVLSHVAGDWSAEIDGEVVWKEHQTGTLQGDLDLIDDLTETLKRAGVTHCTEPDEGVDVDSIKTLAYYMEELKEHWRGPGSVIYDDDKPYFDPSNSQFVVLGSFGGSPPVVVGVFDDWARLVKSITQWTKDEPERFEVAVAQSSNLLIDHERDHILLWDKDGGWNTPDAAEPGSINSLNKL